jgi:Ca2+-binding RTX toxin-like protein
MVYDSDGNLAPGGLYQSAPGFVPAPVGTPVFGEFGRFNSIAEAIAYATPFHGQLSVQADGSITRQQDGKIMVFDDEGNLAQGSEFYNGVLDPSLVIDPNPQTVKVYESRFATVNEAIAYAEANGQGVLTLQPDGVITNQEDKFMVYDSDGNLAPGGLYQSAAGFVPAGKFGRFNSQEEAIAYAESSIQGPLTIQLDGVITNRNGEYMVYDSDGNLAPGGRYQSVPGTGIGEFGRFSSVSEAIAFATANGQGPLSVQVDGSITSQDGKIMVYDSDGNLAPGSEFYDGILDPSLVIDPNPQPIKVYESRFATVDEALAYATANGQGILIVAGDGTITNQNGEVMVYDSDGNLAPAPNGSRSVEPVPVPAVPVSFPNSIRIPEIGSAAYKALLLETGRKDLIGFNYASHLAVKETTDGSALDIYLAAESGKELVEQLEALDLGALFANASAEQILELTERFAQDADFQAFLSKQTTPVVPEFGTPQYSDILESTGRLDLAEFDYEEYVVSVTEAQQALIRAGLDRKYTKITVRNNSSEEDTNISDSAAKALIGSKGNETLRGGLGNDVLISSGGEDILEGGAGKDSVLVAKAASSSQIARDIETNNWVVTTDAGTDTLVGVERLIFEDTSFALDVDRDEIAGQAVLALGALVGPDSIKDPAFVGLVIGLLDDGMSFEELAMAAIETLSLQSDEALATTLWTNVIGAAPSEGELAYVISLLDSGITPAELIRLAAYSEANESNIDLVGLAQRGIAYSDAEG